MGKSKRTQHYIVIYTPEGKERIASPSFVRQLLGICVLREEVKLLTLRVSELEAPGRRERIVALLRKDGDFRTYNWLDWRLTFKPSDLDVLLAEGKLERRRSGSHVLYGVPKDAKEEVS